MSSHHTFGPSPPSFLPFFFVFLALPVVYQLVTIWLSVKIRLRVVYGGRRVGQVLPTYQNRKISALDETADAPQSGLFISVLQKLISLLQKTCPRRSLAAPRGWAAPLIPYAIIDILQSTLFSFIFFHVLLFSLIFFHFLSIFFYVLSFYFILFHFTSFHFVSFSFFFLSFFSVILFSFVFPFFFLLVLFSRALKILFLPRFPHDFVKSSHVKNQFFGPSRRNPIGPSFFLLSIFSFFSFSFSFSISFHAFPFFPLLFFFSFFIPLFSFLFSFF